MAKLKKFSIYHPREGKVNKICAHNYAYEYITSIESSSLVKTLVMASNSLNPDYKALGKRDTTTGDLITVEGDKLYMVNRYGGFERIHKDRALFKTVMELDEAIIEVLSRKKLTDNDVNDLIENCY